MTTVKNMPESSTESTRVYGSARSTFRPDYQIKKYLRISLLEAADYAGVSVRAVQGWIYRKKNPLPRCALRGAYVIDKLELDKFLRKGM
jgi:hypothetical protein